MIEREPQILASVPDPGSQERKIGERVFAHPGVIGIVYHGKVPGAHDLGDLLRDTVVIRF